MRFSMIAFAFAFLVVSFARFGSLAANASDNSIFSQLDGVPLSASEPDVLTAFENIQKTNATPSQNSAPAQKSLFGSGSCVGLQCLIMRQNPNRSQAASNYAQVGERIANQGLSPLEIRARPFNVGNNRVYCSQPNGIHSYATYDTLLTVTDRKRTVFAKFVETSPDEPCHSIATEIFSGQSLVAATAEAQATIEDDFVSAARDKFGTPTYFIPHFKDNGGAPFAAWCDSGTLSDCKTKGPSVNRRLTLTLGAVDGYVNAHIDLEDLEAERKIQANTTKSNLNSSKPQI